MELGKQWNQRVRNHLAEGGIEMTPDEVARERTAAYVTIREEMRKLGHKVRPAPPSEGRE